MRTKRLLLFAVVVFIFGLGTAIDAQTKLKREHLTAAEIEIARETQELDLRIMFYIKAIDRRLAVLSGSAVDPAKTEKLPKNAPDWGELPTGTPGQLYFDIEHILNEAIDRIDDVAVREPDSKLVMRSTKRLGEACIRLMPQLKAFDEKAVPEDKMQLANAIEYAQSVIDSMIKVPANIDDPEPKEKKDKSKKPKDSE